MGAAPLAKTGRSNIQCEDIWVSVWIDIASRVPVPSSGRQGHDTRHDVRRNCRPSSASTARVEDTEDVARTDVSSRCIVWVNDECLRARAFDISERALKLAVEFITRLRRNQVKWCRFGG